MSKNALLLYPNQLFAVEELPKDVDEVVLVEEPLVFGTDQQHIMYMHKQKLVFLRATMRRYMDETLWPAGYKVDYIEFSHLTETEDIVEKLKEFDHVSIFEIDDDVLNRRLMSAIDSHPEAPDVTIIPSPNFYLSVEDCNKFFSNKNKSSYQNFYQWQRERFNILIDPKTYKPLEGKWNIEIKSKRLPVDHTPPSFQVFGSNEFVGEAVEYVNNHFPDNPGSVTDFPWPTNHSEAIAWLQEFLEHRLEEYAVYHDAIDGKMPWMYHSGISPLINCGLLQPAEVVNATIEYAQKQSMTASIIEPFVQNIIGRREYARALYRKYHVNLRTSNTYNHSRRMTHDWYSGTTGILPVDEVINKVKARSYTHQSERIMVLGNIMFLCEFHPDDVYRWFMEMLIDSYDWMVVPNIYGISQGALGSAETKPEISSSNFILSMSHYEKGDWSDVWDGLYWRCIEKYRNQFSKNKSMSIAVKQLDRLDENRKRIISYRAEDFLKTKTILDDVDTPAN
jgi:deoxyribodipyrimidine photolyase-related protein